MNRLNEDDAALEIQCEPGTVTLERAFAERLAEQPQAASIFEPREVVSLYRTELERSCKGGALHAHIKTARNNLDAIEAALKGANK